MEEKNKYWLNEYGERYWYKKSDITINAHRAYYWVNRVTFIKVGKVEFIKSDEIIPYDHWTTSDRRYLKGEKTYTEFKNEIEDWEPIENYDEYTKLLKEEYECRKFGL